MNEPELTSLLAQVAAEAAPVDLVSTAWARGRTRRRRRRIVVIGALGLAGLAVPLVVTQGLGDGSESTLPGGPTTPTVRPTPGATVVIEGVLSTGARYRMEVPERSIHGDPGPGQPDGELVFERAGRIVDAGWSEWVPTTAGRGRRPSFQDVTLVVPAGRFTLVAELDSDVVIQLGGKLRDRQFLDRITVQDRGGLPVITFPLPLRLEQIAVHHRDFSVIAGCPREQLQYEDYLCSSDGAVAVYSTSLNFSTVGITITHLAA